MLSKEEADKQQKELNIKRLYTKPHIHFSLSICEKFPEQTTRWIRSPENARWLLRNKPTSPLSNNQVDELVAVAKITKLKES